MKRIATLLSVCVIMLMSVFAQAQSPDWNDYCGHQFNLIMKTSLPLDGHNSIVGQWAAFFQPKYAVQQHWLYAGVSYDWFILNVGGVTGWLDRDPAFVGFRTINMPLLGPLTSSNEFDLVDYDNFGDFYLWNTIDFNFKIKDHDVWAGLNAESINQSATKTQIGVHVGSGPFEIYSYHGHNCGTNIRTVFSIPL
jgi:hypothetical protein